MTKARWTFVWMFVLGVVLTLWYAPQYKMENMGDYLKSQPALFPNTSWFGLVLALGCFFISVGVVGFIFSFFVTKEQVSEAIRLLLSFFAGKPKTVSLFPTLKYRSSIFGYKPDTEFYVLPYKYAAALQLLSAIGIYASFERGSEGGRSIYAIMRSPNLATPLSSTLIVDEFGKLCTDCLERLARDIAGVAANAYLYA